MQFSRSLNTDCFDAHFCGQYRPVVSSTLTFSGSRRVVTLTWSLVEGWFMGVYDTFVTDFVGQRVIIFVWRVPIGCFKYALCPLDPSPPSYFFSTPRLRGLSQNRGLTAVSMKGLSSRIPTPEPRSSTWRRICRNFYSYFTDHSIVSQRLLFFFSLSSGGWGKIKLS